MEIPESLSPSGRRRRYFFSTKEEAQLFAKQQISALRLYGIQGGGILPSLVQKQASRALDAIKSFGVPLARVVAEWIKKDQLENKAIRFEETMDLFIANRQRERL